MRSVRQRIVPMGEFAEAMLAADASFAERVRGYELVFAKADSDALAVMAQANYFCWFEVEYERDYMEVCRAIGAGRPTSLYLCRQVSPARWVEMNAYVLGVQRWLGVECPCPEARASKIHEWLAERTPAKEALAWLFVRGLADDLLHLSLAKLSGADDPDDAPYEDLTPWYPDSAPVEHLEAQTRRQMASAPKDAEALIGGITRASQPACQHRFARYLDIKVSSIGALRWRGNVPPDVDVPKRAAEEWFGRADLTGWMRGEAPGSDLLAGLHAALGVPTERKKALVRDFLLVPPGGGFFEWLDDRARKTGTTAAALFGRL